MIPGLISCIIPTYKRSDTLLRAVESILHQTYNKLEVIVVDDNEPNNKYSIEVQKKLNTIKDNRLIYIQQERHINGAAARNVGIKTAKGEYIAFLDDDDEWHPIKLEKQINELGKKSEFGAVTCLTTLYRNGNLIRKSAPYSNENLHKKVLDRSVSIFTPTVLFRREALDKSGYFDEDLLRHQDLQLLLDFLKKNKMLVLQEYLVSLHIDDAGNRPDVDRLVGIKQQFLRKMNNHLKCYSQKEQKNIYAAHYFEIIFIALKEKNIKIVISYLLKIGFNITAYYTVLKRFINRKNVK